jgi:peptidoglycan hydrolase-like protein with peptidoglycan-binding domain
MALTLQQKQAITERACQIIFSNEGNYGSVNKNDNGAVSIGKVQWHAGRALNLLKTIVKANKNQANQMLGSTLYNEILNSSNWNKRIVTQIEADKISALLQTPQGKKAQDELAKSDVLSYVNKGISYGLQNEEALIYFADGVNQYGTASTLWKKIAEAAIKKGGTLDAMFEATKSMTSNYISRRTKVYNTLKTQSGTAIIESNPIKILPDKTTIKMIQKWINDYCNIKIDVDGEFGPQSKKGMTIALQHYLNLNRADPQLVEDGIFGSKTSAACTYVSSSHLKKSDLAFIAQCLLYVNGYDPQGLDSIFGKDSTEAAKLFQAEHNLEPDGEVGKLTFRKLLA